MEGRDSLREVESAGSLPSASGDGLRREERLKDMLPSVALRSCGKTRLERMV